ncbi:MAG: choice-of-anchor B family protein [Phycisphaerales bacterium]|nr:choice-of-anchor B family protein [Phycisphaerales bacterium]
MRSTAYLGHASIALGLLAGSLALAHEDDPKAFEKRTPNLNPSWRLDVDGPNDGLAGAGSGITLAANITMPEIDSGQDGNDCWGYTSPSGREYAIMGTTGGTSFIEVTNPGNPQIIQYIDGPNSLWRDVKTYGSYAYIVTEGGGGIQVVAMNNIDNGSVSLVNTITTGGGAATHNVAIDPVRGLLARCGGGSSGLRIYDLFVNPTNPPFVGEWSDEYVHDAQIHTMSTGPYAGRTIAFCCGGLNGGSTNTGLDIVDISSPSNPVRLGGMQYPGGAYCHQGWLSDDEQYFYINDELYSGTSSTFIVRVSDLTNPVYVTRWTNNNAAICHNLYVQGDLIYCANYRSGLRILDRSNPQALTEVGFYDTYPANDGQSFNGLWSCYPYFPSGTVIGSDIESGLFVWSTDLSYVNFEVTQLDDPMASAGGTVGVQLEANDTTLDPSTAVAVFNDGSGTQQISLDTSDGVNYTGTLPALECPGTLTIRFAVFDTEGELYESEVSTVGISDGSDVIADDDFNNSAGWTAETTASVGGWERAIPSDDTISVDQCSAPGTDADGSGYCWVTGNGVSTFGCEFDIDGGATVLTSAVYEVTDINAVASFSWWYDNTSANNTEYDDDFIIEVSSNSGASWTTHAVISNGNSAGTGWTRESFPVSDYASVGDGLRLRFTASDNDPGSVVEAGIDAFRIETILCDDGGIPGDIDGDGQVDGSDLSICLGFWGPCAGENCPADLNGDGLVDGTDLSTILGYWTTDP